MYAGMKFDLEETMNSLSVQGHKSDAELFPILLKREKIVDRGRRSHATKETPQIM